MALDPETEITITCGVTEAIIASLLGVVDPGDRVIIAAYAVLDEAEIAAHRPVILQMDEENRIRPPGS